jgi:hypothetical protein
LDKGEKMSVETEADVKIEKIRSDIEDATKNMGAIVIDKVWGSEDFDIQYRIKLGKALLELVNMLSWI